MPTYDYQCRSCGSVTEVIHSMMEEGPKICERCGGDLRRVLYPAGIIFKGSGFYRTDSRSANGANSASSEAASSGTDAPKGSSATTGGDASSSPPSTGGASKTKKSTDTATS